MIVENGFIEPDVEAEKLLPVIMGACFGVG
jgi:hypothetical protein